MLREKVAEAAFVATVSEYNRRLIVDECGGRFADKVHIVRAGVDTQPLRRRAQRRPPAERRAAADRLRRHAARGQGPGAPRRGLSPAGRDRGVAVALPVHRRGRGPGGTRGRHRGRRARGQREPCWAPRPRPEVAAQLRDAHVLVAPSVPTRGRQARGHPGRAHGGHEQRVARRGQRPVGHPRAGGRRRGRDPVAARRRARDRRRARPAAADPALRAALGEAGRRRIEEEFDVRSSVDRLLEHMATGQPA